MSGSYRQFEILVRRYKDGIPKNYNLLGKTFELVGKKVPKLTTKKWVEVHDQTTSVKHDTSNIPRNDYKVNKQIRFKKSMLQLDLCDYRDAYFVIKGDIIATGANKRDRKNRPLIFKNNAQFTSCI